MPVGKHLSVVVAASLLAGCSVMDSVWSVLSGGSGTPSTGRVIAIPTPKSDTAAQPVTLSGTTAPTPAPRVPVQAAPLAPATLPPTPTIVALSGPTGAPLAATPAATASVAAAPQAQGSGPELRRLQEDIGRQNSDIQRVHQALAQDGANYYGTVATIHSRLQTGTTAGNPELVAQWNLAQVALDRMSADIARLAVLSGETASGSTVAARILDQVKAGAGDAALERDAKTAQGQVQLLVDAIAQDIARQTAYLDNERSNLVTLLAAIKTGELYGRRLPDGRYVVALRQRDLEREAAVSGSSERKPLVVIRFRHPDVAYEQQLYGAVKSAVERRRDVVFDVIAVAPVATTPAQMDANGRAAKRYAATVFHTLTEMGVPAERVLLSATTSDQVRNEEVQIYVR